MRKILFLGGSTHQITPIRYAAAKGDHTILCDYLPDNPGQYFADEYYCVSTTDQEAVLKVAIDCQIDGILAYASDPAAPTAAYVANQLGLPSNPYESVMILSRKDRFRRFLKDNGFNTPMARGYVSYENALSDLGLFKFPLMVKPNDSSGSKGVSRILSEKEFKEAFAHAMSMSGEKRVILEEYVQMAHDQMIGGDGFIVGGKLAFCGALNSHRDLKLSPFIPIGTSYPLFMDDDHSLRVRNEVQRLISLLGLTMGGINLELMFDERDDLHIIEVGARNGGNMIPELLEMATGVDMIGASVEMALGNHQIDMSGEIRNIFCSTYVLHTPESGILRDIGYSEALKGKVLREVLYREPGSRVERFDGANKAIGIIFLKYDNLEEMKYRMANMDEFVHIHVDALEES
jgi:biotin carboxylase